MVKILELGLDNGSVFKNLEFEGSMSDLHAQMNNEAAITFSVNHSSLITIYGYKIAYLIFDNFKKVDTERPVWGDRQSHSDILADFYKKYCFSSGC